MATSSTAPASAGTPSESSFAAHNTPEDPTPPPTGPGGSAMAKEKKRRSSLACSRCRIRKGKCDAHFPCASCRAAGVVCDPPDPSKDGRKRARDRTRKRPAQEDVVKEDEREQSAGLSMTSSGPAFSPELFHYSQPAMPFFGSPAEHSQPPIAGPSNSHAILANLATSPSNNHLAPFAQSSFGAAEAAAGLETLANGSALMGGPSGMAPAPRLPPPPPPPAPMPTSDAVPRLQYHRPFGPTAIQPGLEQINISIAAPPTFSRAQSPTGGAPSNPPPAQDFMQAFADPQYSSPHNQHENQVPSFSFFPPSRVDRFFEEGADVPRQEIQEMLFDLFFKHMGSHFPFLSLRYLQQLDSNDSPSKRVDGPMLINAVCALAARFSDNPLVRGPDTTRSPALFGVTFADKAKGMLVALLGFPSPATVQSLLLLAYFEFGLNSEGAFWMYSRMALAMAQDLGLHLDIRRQQVDPQTRSANRLTWWACVILDRTLALGTGRPTTIKEHEISVPPPTDEDIAIVAQDNPHPLLAATIASPFPAYVQMMRIYGELADIANNVTEPWGSPTMQSEPPSRGEPAEGAESTNLRLPAHQPTGLLSLNALEDRITRIYSELPADLSWNPSIFRQQHDAGYGPIYIHLHLWYHAILILLYRPPLVYPRTNAADLSLADRLAVVNNSSLAIGSILSGADFVDPMVYVASPFVNHCFFLASSAWIQDYRIRTGRNVLESSGAGESNPAPANSSINILANTALQNFNACQSALNRQAKHWLGVGWIGAIVDKQGAKASRSSIKTATEGLHTFVSGPEMAVFRRLAQRISGGVRTPDLDADAMSALFTMLHQDNMAAQNYNLTPDDFALAYTFASTFPDAPQF